MPKTSIGGIALADQRPKMPSEHWQSGPENLARGSAWLDRIYQDNRTATINTFASHKDFGK